MFIEQKLHQGRSIVLETDYLRSICLDLVYCCQKTVLSSAKTSPKILEAECRAHMRDVKRPHGKEPGLLSSMGGYSYDFVGSPGRDKYAILMILVCCLSKRVFSSPCWAGPSSVY